MKVSFPGLFINTEIALRSSRDESACSLAYVLGEMFDNLLKVKTGDATLEEFFACYVVNDEKQHALANRVDKKNYFCMREDEEDDNDNE
jgi:hypothetical protein